MKTLKRIDFECFKHERSRLSYHELPIKFPFEKEAFCIGKKENGVGSCC